MPEGAKGTAMTNFTGAPCPVCKKNFTKDDRPVVCPDCGAPYHRDCYNIKKVCEFSGSHGADFAWEKTPDAGISKSDIPKPEKPDDFDVLEEVIKKVTAQNSVKPENSANPDKPDNPVNTDNPTPDERFLFGVSEKELNCFSGGLSPVRLLRFRRIASGRIVSVNIFAAIFSPFYMFYMRMRGVGLILMLISVLLFPPFAIQTTSAPVNLTPSDESLFLSVALLVLIALFYDYAYLRWSTRRIKTIRSRFYPEVLNDRPEIPDMPSVSEKLEGLEDDYYAYLQAVGAPGFRYMLFDGLSALVLINLVFYSFGGTS